jgi:PylC-like, N-terminal domain
MTPVNEPAKVDQRGRPRGAGLRSSSVTTVLFTCAGQCVDIVTAFRRAGATTLAVDVDPLAPALYSADVRATVPRFDDPSYVEALRKLVAAHRAGSWCG